MPHYTHWNRSYSTSTILIYIPCYQSFKLSLLSTPLSISNRCAHLILRTTSFKSKPVVSPTECNCVTSSHSILSQIHNLPSSVFSTWVTECKSKHLAPSFSQFQHLLKIWHNSAICPNSETLFTNIQQNEWTGSLCQRTKFNKLP